MQQTAEPAVVLPAPNLFSRTGRALTDTFRFWMRTEVHVYAFSVAANILLSFFPCLIVIMSLCQHVFKWRAAVDAIFFSLNDYFPGPISDYIVRNLKAVVASRGPFQLISILVLLFTANGVFQPLEVALNRIWKCSTDRSYFKNQLISLGLIFACGGLILLSMILTAFSNQLLASAVGNERWLASFLEQTFYKLAAIPMSMLMLFLIYWMLPNCRISPSAILPAAIGVGVLLEVLKYLNLLLWPYFRPKFASEYGPFTYAATIILWGFLASMLILAGAHWAATRTSTEADPLQTA